MTLNYEHPQIVCPFPVQLGAYQTGTQPIFIFKLPSSHNIMVTSNF